MRTLPGLLLHGRHHGGVGGVGRRGGGGGTAPPGPQPRPGVRLLPGLRAPGVRGLGRDPGAVGRPRKAPHTVGGLTRRSL